MIHVIDNYDSFTYNLVQLIAALGGEVQVSRNDAVTPADVVAGRPSGIVISPGPGGPDDAGISKAVVSAAGDAQIPVLGVCLGHQCVGEVFGARVGRAPVPVHGKTANVLHSGEGLFEGVPSPFTATRYHSLVVEADTVPDVLEVTARTEDGLVMALTHRELPIYGVQFHPESVLTPEGTAILANFLAMTGEVPREKPAEARQAVPSPAPAAGPAPSTAGVGPVAPPGGAPAAGPVASPGGAPAAGPAPSTAGAATIRQAISRVAAGTSLDEEESTQVMGAVMDGEATPSQISALVTAMRMKGETVDEITGFARAMRQRATPIRPKTDVCIDTCGTGGDGLSTFNISTATAFVVAGAGVPIAKHGNRAVSSASGSADVLEALGVRIDLAPEAVARCIDEVGVGFLFAQALHSSMRHAGPTRREIAIRTVFNILGPLTNPAGARRQLLGVYDAALAPVIAEVAGRLGAERVLVVNGHPGMDEVSVSGPTTVSEYADGAVRTYEITPEELGIARGSADDLTGGDAQANARILRSVLRGEAPAQADVVLANAAAALLAAGAAPDLAKGVEAARLSIASGAALGRLDALTALTAELAPVTAGTST
jgi:anthranilate synthase/phosphoribosyltransferase